MDLSNAHVIFFDVHETLIHIAHSPEEIFHALCNEVGADVSLAAIRELYPDEESLERRREAHGDDLDFWSAFNNELVAELGLSDPGGALAAFITEGFTRDQWWKAYDDVIPALKALKSHGYKLGVIANARDLVLGRLQFVGLSDYFDAITYSDEVGSKKPDAKIFQVALERAGCKPQEAVHIGDRLREDVEGARTVGISPVLLDRQNQHPNYESMRVLNLREFADLFLQTSP